MSTTKEVVATLKGLGDDIAKKQANKERLCNLHGLTVVQKEMAGEWINNALIEDVLSGTSDKEAAQKSYEESL